MGRPSKKAERTEQIMQAFQRCVARYGLEGSSLERIAEESGLQRSLVRHFAGNRDQLVQQLADNVIQQSEQQWSDYLTCLPQAEAIGYLLDGLFSDDHSDAEYVLVIESLIFAAGQDPELLQKMQGWMQRFTDDIETILKRDFPSASGPDIQAVAFGLVSIYFNLDSLAPLNMNQQFRIPARRAAELMIIPLRATQGDA